MSNTVFTETRFWLLVALSIGVPGAIYFALLRIRATSKFTVLFLGLLFVAVAGVDVYLLQTLAVRARETASLADDLIFVSEISAALYLLPAMFGGIGVNIISHVLLRHLNDAEHRFDREQRRDRGLPSEHPDTTRGQP